MNLETAKKDLLERGYCSFNLKDFDEESFDYIQKYKCNSEKSLKNLIKSLRADYKNPYQKDSSENVNKEYKSFEEAENAKWEILNNKSIVRDDFFQIWLYTNINDSGLYKIYDKIIKYFFDLDDKENLSIETSISLYNQGCFLKDHIDGKSPVKNYASVLIYLNENYDENNGGNLILNKKYKVVPEFGTVAMIELQNFDIHHQVEEIINDSERYCLIAFPFNKKNQIL